MHYDNQTKKLPSLIAHQLSRTTFCSIKQRYVSSPRCRQGRRSVSDIRWTDIHRLYTVLPTCHATSVPSSNQPQKDKPTRTMRSLSQQIVVTITSLLVAAQPILAQTSQGCFTSSTGLQDQGTYLYQSTGYCQKACVALNLPVYATTGGADCWCGSQLPPANSKTSDSACSKPCQGFPAQICKPRWSSLVPSYGHLS